MNRLLPKLFFLLTLMLFLQSANNTFCQTSLLPIGEWSKKLETKSDENGFLQVAAELKSKDSTGFEVGLRALENQKSANLFYNARILILRAYQAYRFQYVDRNALIERYYELGLNEAYRTGDEAFISKVCESYASMMASTQEIELSATYYLKAEEINEDPQNHVKDPFVVSIALGEILFHTREYEKSIYYLRRGLDHWQDTSAFADYLRIRYFNTMGQAYEQLDKLDSAMIDYQTSMQFTHKLGDTTWIGINDDFMGQFFYLKKDYADARSLLEAGFGISKVYEWNIAANTLQWLARINLIEGKKDSAIVKLKEALAFLRKSSNFPFQQVNFLQNIYFVMADAYRAAGKTDSFYHYFDLYTAVHDSLDRVATFSSLKISQLRIDNEKDYRALKEIRQQADAAAATRNFIILGIILIAIIILLFMNRARTNLAMKEKMAKADITAAKEQLQLFTQNILEKVILIESLQQQLHNNALNKEQQQSIEILSNQTILTDSDWHTFRTLFEKIYPGFFSRLKVAASDITIAEQRMAALTMLHLTTRQMASMLGISPNSVSKTRQRMRQRFNMPADANVEDFILNL
jgi:DNA-binding CsgD family transcriptional regulator/tetratricopeptide (TPR) repeat protein